MSLKVGCQWVIKFKGLVRDKSQFWCNEGEKFQINSVHYVHTCEPSLIRYFKVIDRADIHTQTINKNANFQLFTMLDDDPRTNGVQPKTSPFSTRYII